MCLALQFSKIKSNVLGRVLARVLVFWLIFQDTDDRHVPSICESFEKERKILMNISFHFF